MDSVPTTLPFVARACAVPAPMPVARPRPATLSTLVLELLHVNAALGTSVPFASRATAVTCTPSPVDSDVLAADSVMLAIGPGPVTVMPIDPLAPSDATRMLAAVFLVEVLLVDHHIGLRLQRADVGLKHFAVYLPR